ncbi:MAG: HAD-IA family hydrolase [Ginsengibacter sp.]
MNKQNHIKAFIFDMDGTIVNNTLYHTKAWLQFLNKYGISIKEEELHAKIFGASEEIMPRFFGKDLSRGRNVSLAGEKETLYRNLYKELIVELRGLSHLLRIAKRKKIAVALATMSDIHNISFIVDKLNIRSSFDMIAGAEQVTNGKPHPEIYELVLSTLKIKPAEAVVFEDSQGGVLSAIAAGIPVIGVCTTHSKEKFKEWGVDVCINDFEEYIGTYMTI